MQLIRNLLRNYQTDETGNFAVWFAVMALPLLIGVSSAIDFRQAEYQKAAMKGALDSAVLAAVSDANLTTTQKEELAKKIFYDNYDGDIKFELEAKATDNRVQLIATGEVPSSIGSAVGMGGWGVQSLSAAEMIQESTICVLALASEGEAKLRFLEETKFNSPTCSVQSNSKHDRGAFSDTTNPPIAKSFCTAGGAKGTFLPNIKGQCKESIDPYADRPSPKPGACMPDSTFAKSPTPIIDLGGGAPVQAANLGLPPNGHEPGVSIVNNGNNTHTHWHCHLEKEHCHSGSHTPNTLHAPTPGLRLQNMGIAAAQVQRLIGDYGLDFLNVTESTNYSGSDKIFSPGTYCGGLTVDGKNVNFMPGVYIMKDGPLTFKNGADATATDVSFVFHGMNSVLTVESNSRVKIKAPRSGSMAGLALYEDRHVSKKPTTESKYPTAANLISSGGSLNVTGTMYFPTQALEVVGNSILGAEAPATSFIAHQVTFGGGSKASVKVDHMQAGIPPMLPRSDDGARLVK